MPFNRLKNSLSPYLLQHASNPVNWFEWGEEAFSKARAEDKPIFLSIGYSACHWCHVMERESFEDVAVAEVLNQHFVSIKVDREERPDVDDIYMTAVQMMTGSGGWPLTLFLTPDLKPFYGGTYFPPEERYGRPGFKRLLESIADLWSERRRDIENSAIQLLNSLTGLGEHDSRHGKVSDSQFNRAVELITSAFDPANGGFGPPPKFPPTGQLDLLMRAYAKTQRPETLKMVERTLDKISSGGIFDHLGGGFARYSTDASWFVPHFEKMLYDNALLAMNFIDAHTITKNHAYADIARRTLNWAIDEMQMESGGFASSLDADSEGEEGKYYLWTLREIQSVIGFEDAQLFAFIYGITEPGNYESRSNILHIAASVDQAASKFGISSIELSHRLELSRKKLFAARLQRIRPHRDDKILTDWNGLMLAALARGYRFLGDERYLDSAHKLTSFIRLHMWRDGKLLHNNRAGKSGVAGMLDDYAFTLWGLTELYQSIFDSSLIVWALKIADSLLEAFWDQENSGFFQTPQNSDYLILRLKYARDSATPSGNAIAALTFYRLSQLTGRDDFRQIAGTCVNAFAGSVDSHPTAHLRLTSLIEELNSPSVQIVIAGNPSEPETQNLLSVVNNQYLPSAITACGLENDNLIVKLLDGKNSVNNKPAAYVCQNFTCMKPVTSAGELQTLFKLDYFNPTE